ncbi:MAG: M15 family metallopeptidase [Christensenellales bacterium]
MQKKAIAAFLVLLIMLSFCPDALAAETPGYTAEPSATEVFYGSAFHLNITTPEDAAQVKMYVDGRYVKKAALTGTGAGQKNWEASIVLKKVGSRNIQCRAYGINGTLLSRFPESPLSVTVKHLLPVTNDAIVLDSDRAVLLAAPPAYCGVKQREYGFYYGTDPQALTLKVKSNRLVREKMNRLVTGLSPGTTYYYYAYVVTSLGTLTGDVLSFSTPAQKAYAAGDAVFENTADRYKYLFGTEDKFYTLKNPPYGYATSSEASKHMVTISVPVWKISGGKKVEGAMSLTVNRKLEHNVKAIFEEIHALDIQFPVMALKAYSYRRISGPGLYGSPIMSHHSFGSAIDINKPHNLFYRYRDKRNTNSPYYIPQAVIDIFAKYGWAWGGNFKEGFDTMHFQYLGLDLTR